jgi:hypothetical protein
MQQGNRAIYQCWCGSLSGTKREHCSYCNTPEKRKAILDESNKIRIEAGMAPLHLPTK